MSADFFQIIREREKERERERERDIVLNIVIISINLCMVSHIVRNLSFWGFFTYKTTSKEKNINTEQVDLVKTYLL